MTKTAKILDFFTYRGQAGGTRREAAEHAGCTVQRVGEVIRARAELFTSEGKVYRLALPVADVTTVDLAEEHGHEVRFERCEHERRRKIKTGKCKECPPYVAS